MKSFNLLDYELDTLDDPTASEAEIIRMMGLVTRFRLHGYDLRLAGHVGTAIAPDLTPMVILGRTDHFDAVVWVASKPSAHFRELCDTFEHELRHVVDRDWQCGSENVVVENLVIPER